MSGLFGQFGTKLGPYGAEHSRTKTLTIVDGESDTTVNTDFQDQFADLNGYPSVLLFVPAAFDGTLIRFYTIPSVEDAADYVPLNDDTGARIEIPVAADSAVDITAFVCGVRWLALESDAAQSGAGAVFTLQFKG